MGNFIYVRKKVKSRDGLVGYTYVDGNKKCAGRITRKLLGWWGLKGQDALFGILFVTLSGELLRFKPDCPILGVVYM